jgi:hypothetical protein
MTLFVIQWRNGMAGLTLISHGVWQLGWDMCHSVTRGGRGQLPCQMTNRTRPLGGAPQTTVQTGVTRYHSRHHSHQGGGEGFARLLAKTITGEGINRNVLPQAGGLAKFDRGYGWREK